MQTIWKHHAEKREPGETIAELIIRLTEQHCKVLADYEFEMFWAGAVGSVAAECGAIRTDKDVRELAKARERAMDRLMELFAKDAPEGMVRRKRIELHALTTAVRYARKNEGKTGA